MNKEKLKTFIENENNKTDKLNKTLENFLEKWKPQLDWRDDKEIEIHLKGDLSTLNINKLYDMLNENNFNVLDMDWRYSNTLRIYFKENYFGSFGLEDYSEEDLKDFFSSFPEIYDQFL